MGRKEEFYVGLMSGTSADGIDAVVAGFSAGASLKARILAHTYRSFPKAVRAAILRVATGGTVAELCELNFVLGRWFGRAAVSALAASGLRAGQVTAIGSHGQTVRHLPNARTPSTLQIGEPALIAELTGVTTVADFRVGDVAAGGQGAPLVPYADWALLNDRRRPRIIQNIGGIANLTFLSAGASLDEVIAFDTGPGNMVIDGLVAELSGGKLKFDRHGAWAARGRVREGLLRDLLSHPFFRKRPPKSTGREEFGLEYAAAVLARASHDLAPEDLVATVTALTAESIAGAYRRFVFPLLARRERSRVQIILGGGGAKNRTLRRMLAERLGGNECLTHEDFGIDDTAKEALAFALLARQTLRGEPGNVPGATGARHPVVLGKIVLGTGKPLRQGGVLAQLRRLDPTRLPGFSSNRRCRTGQPCT